ncbi:MAG TPA: hypothetical protein VFV50_10265 [Bdellovibrionales bacterium]|nr:hypothetical protein [Bdellovibrionales bacterium]
MLKRIAALAVLLFLSSPANALVEFHGFAGFAFNDSNSLNRQLSSSGITQIYVTGIYGLDGRLNFPGFPLGLGLRYDWQGIKVSRTETGLEGNEFEVSSKRLAALANFRFIDKIGYIGLVGTIGIQHSPTAMLKAGGTTSNYDNGKSTSGTIGIEGGLSLGGLRLGAEGGYQDYMVRELRGPSGNANFDINFCGFYGIAHVGFGF